MVRDLFRDREANEFIIATIPTVLAVKESSRLLAVLRKEGIPCRQIVVNQVSLASVAHVGLKGKGLVLGAPLLRWLQVIGPGMGEAYLKLKLGDQRRAFQMISRDPQLQSLQQLSSPLVDLEVRGIVALQYFGSKVWSTVLDGYLAGEDGTLMRCAKHRCGLSAPVAVDGLS